MTDKTDFRGEMLAEAGSIVSGARDEQYGSPEDNFTTIANLWAAYKKVDISAKDVANMMILLKIAREGNRHSRDNFIDIAGYAACGFEIEETKVAQAAQDDLDRLELPL